MIRNPTDAISTGSVTFDLRVAELCESHSLPLQYLPPLKPFELLFRASGSVVGFKPLECFDFICLFFFVPLYSVIHAASMGFPLLGSLDS